MNIFSRLKGWSDSRGISQQEVADADWTYVEAQLEDLHFRLKMAEVSGYVLNKVEELAEYATAMREGNENEAVDAIADSRVFDATELCKMGYNIEMVDDEVLNVIESRTGVWDATIGKFMKDKSPEAKARWYKHNYPARCKETNSTGSLFGEA